MSHVKPLLIRTVFFCLGALKKTECEESLQKVYRDREKTLYLYLIYYLANCCIDLQ